NTLGDSFLQLTLQPGSSVTGTVHAGQVTIKPGANFSGNLSVEGASFVTDPFGLPVVADLLVAGNYTLAGNLTVFGGATVQANGTLTTTGIVSGNMTLIKGAVILAGTAANNMTAATIDNAIMTLNKPAGVNAIGGNILIANQGVLSTNTDEQL